MQSLALEISLRSSVYMQERLEVSIGPWAKQGRSATAPEHVRIARFVRDSEFLPTQTLYSRSYTNTYSAC